MCVYNCSVAKPIHNSFTLLLEGMLTKSMNFRHTPVIQNVKKLRQKDGEPEKELPGYGPARNM